MAVLTTVDIARAWAAAFAADRALSHWAKMHYDKAFSFSIGADMRRPPQMVDAPFITVFPDSGTSGPQRAAVSHELGIVIGIADNAWTDAGGLKEMQALARLNELCPMLEKIMRMVPGALPHEFSVEYEILQFPLVMALCSVTVENSLPVGRR